MNGPLEDSPVIKALGEAATAVSPRCAKLAVYALGFFGGPAATEILRERVQADEDRFVRYNAAVALARRGDLAAAPTLREMLSTADLEQGHRSARHTEKQNKIESIELEALEALRTSISGNNADLATSPSPSDRPT